MFRSFSLTSKVNISALLAALLVLVGFLTVNFQPVSAESRDPSTINCSGKWKYASWGRGCAYRVESHFVGKSDDTLTDGYCVKIRRKKNNGNVYNVSGSQSCGATSGWATKAYTYNDTQWLRLVRDNGNYLTIWSD